MAETLFLSTGLPFLQNRVYPTRDEARACETGDIRLVQTASSGIVQNAAFDPARVIYDAHYNNEQSISAPFRRHLDEVANLIDRSMGRRNLVEVGCGKGAFLEMLLARGFDLTGFDPAYEGANPRVRRHFFGPGVDVSGDGVILRHVLEHIPDPVTFMEQLAAANGNRGLIYIEVPCLDWILRQRAWFDIFYEHVNYFRLADFHRLFGRVVHGGHSFGGQYLTVVADLATFRRPDPAAIPPVVFPDGFSGPPAAPMRSNGAPEIVWGGASKGVIFALMRERAGAPVDRVIDINPAKQGRHLPCTGLLVQTPEDGLQGMPPETTIYVMNPNYLDEIRAMSGNRFHYVGMSND